MPFEDDHESARYAALLKQKDEHWESLCTRCGACCGIIEGDPCENLAKDAFGKYYCRIYEDRFGTRKTVSGKTFECVPLRQILYKHWPGDHLCGYKGTK